MVLVIIYFTLYILFFPFSKPYIEELQITKIDQPRCSKAHEIQGSQFTKSAECFYMCLITAYSVCCFYSFNAIARGELWNWTNLRGKVLLKFLKHNTR
jgi:hypothetical protein